MDNNLRDLFQVKGSCDTQRPVISHEMKRSDLWIPFCSLLTFLSPKANANCDSNPDFVIVHHLVRWASNSQVRKVHVGSACSRVKMSAMLSRYSVQRLYSFAFYAHRERLCDVTFKAKFAVENNSRNVLHIQFTPTSNVLFIVKISA